MLTSSDVAALDDPFVVAASIELRTPQWLADVQASDPDIIDPQAVARAEVEAALEERLRELGPYTTFTNTATGDMVVAPGGIQSALVRFAAEFGYAYDADANTGPFGPIWEIGDRPLMYAPTPTPASDRAGSIVLWA